MKILKNETLALFVDFQKNLLPSIKNHKEIIQNSSKLLKCLYILDIPVIFTQQYTKGLGETVIELQEVDEEKFSYMEKDTFSIYKNDLIKNKLKSLNKKNIILCGTEAHVCVLQSLIDLRDNGYNVILIGDCIGSRHSEDKKFALKRAEYEGAIISSYEAIIFELLETSDTTIFKSILNIVK